MYINLSKKKSQLIALVDKLLNVPNVLIQITFIFFSQSGFLSKKLILNRLGFVSFERRLSNGATVSFGKLQDTKALAFMSKRIEMYNLSKHRKAQTLLNEKEYK